MGKVLVAVKVENLSDVYDAHKGRIQSEQVRTAELADALVDTGATLVAIPQRLIEQLGLIPVGTRRARTIAGPMTVSVYTGVRLTIQGRSCISDVTEAPDDCPVLIGQVPLEALDFVVDPNGRRLIGNPDHAGEQMVDLF